MTKNPKNSFYVSIDVDLTDENTFFDGTNGTGEFYVNLILNYGLAN